MYQASFLIEENAELEKSYLMMKSLLEMGSPPDAVATMMQLQGFCAQHIQYFAGPLVVHDLPWKSQLPKHLIKACYLERLKLVCDERKSNFIGNQAAQADVFAAMFPALMEALVNPDCGIPWRWGKVALYCSCEVGLRHKWIGSIEEQYKSVNLEPINFKEIQADYKEIAADVRSRVVKVAKKQGWEAAPKPASKPVSQPRPTTLQRPSVIQSKPKPSAQPVEVVQLNLL